MGIDEAIQKHLDLWKAEILANYKSKNRKASGHFGQVLRVEVKDNNGQILGADYSGAIDYGRGVTTRTGTGESLQKRIYKWIDDKGIRYESEKEHVSLSWAMSKYIHKHGIKVPRSGAHPLEQIIEPVLTQSNIDKLKYDLSVSFITEITNKIREAWQQ